MSYDDGVLYYIRKILFTLIRKVMLYLILEMIYLTKIKRQKDID